MHAIVLLTSLVLAAAQDVEPSPPEGFRALFDGRSLEGFCGGGTEDPHRLLAMDREERRALADASLPALREHWRVEGGELVNGGEGPYLTTVEDFGDFELLIDFCLGPGADSGIYLRGIPQVQVWDSTEAGGHWRHGAQRGSGGLWNNPPECPGREPRVHADRPVGEWNRFRIRMIGAYVTVHLNGELVVADAVLENYFDRKRPVPVRGPLQLQTHGGELRWRNLFLREIGAEEANLHLAALDPEGFAPLLVGPGLAGWRGDREGYELLSDGVLRCRPGSGGNLFTEAEYGDFELALEIFFPPGGNNGLAIRYPGEGDPAYSGMCELQVLEESHPPYARLDPRQQHGSAYGMVAAHRGYQRPVGEWNFQRVRVRGSSLRVELNGFWILDCDLAEVEEVLDGRPHPGRTRSRGHLGFAGHGDPVAFRNLRLRELR